MTDTTDMTDLDDEFKDARSDLHVVLPHSNGIPTDTTPSVEIDTPVADDRPHVLAKNFFSDDAPSEDEIDVDDSMTSTPQVQQVSIEPSTHTTVIALAGSARDDDDDDEDDDDDDDLKDAELTPLAAQGEAEASSSMSSISNSPMMKPKRKTRAKMPHYVDTYVDPVGSSDTDSSTSDLPHGLKRKRSPSATRRRVHPPIIPTMRHIKSRRNLKTGYVYDIFMSFHANLHPYDLHPEDPRRIFYIYRQMQEEGLLASCQRIPIVKPTSSDITTVHTKDHLRQLQATQHMTRKELLHLERNGDSLYVNGHTYESSLYAAGGVIEVCRAVVHDEVKNGFAIVRPPGHHAEPDEFMGFCFLNNVAIATKYCRHKLGVKRVMIVDWDVHFGNGTYEVFKNDEHVLYVSLHRYEDATFYPADENGDYVKFGSSKAAGKMVNVPWPSAGMTDADYMHAFHQIVMPVGHEFNPDLVIVSAGFDAASGDYIGMCHVTPAGYSQMTHMLMGLAGGRLVMALEGGYDLTATAESAAACMKVLVGEPPAPLTIATPSQTAVETVKKVKNVQKLFWRSLGE
ncbi:hypothetical protein BC940DRAFT_313343 [Gongronella butleri]|nr:hypothetical protein BC940DRAFT_313343 [Gongronella butleri]